MKGYSIWGYANIMKGYPKFKVIIRRDVIIVKETPDSSKVELQ